MYEKVNSKELKELNLSYNDISDINILEKVNFKELKELNLSHINEKKKPVSIKNKSISIKKKCATIIIFKKNGSII